jgi:hypothetical protein
VSTTSRPYVAKGEISFGDMALPSYVDLDQLIDTAGNDMDAEIGKRYKLPLKFNPENSRHVPVINLLAKINRYLVVGRVVIDAAIGSEDNSLQAYGNYHLRMAESALKQIAEGKVEMPDQEVIIPDDSNRVTGPMISGARPSLVDSYYNGDYLNTLRAMGRAQPW